MKIFKTIEKRIFLPSIVIAATVIFFMLFIPEKSKFVINTLFSYMTNDLGWIYLLIVNIMLIFSLWMCFSKYGNLKFDDTLTKPEYSTFSWVAMMFTAGISIAIILLGFIEPISLISKPPFDIEPLSNSAYEYAHMYDQFLYGLSAWIIYAPATIAICYTIYIKKDPLLRISNACKPVLGEQSKGLLGTLIDVIVMLGMIGGISTSIGMGIPLVTSLIEHLTNIPQGVVMTCSVLFVWALIFGTSVFLGLDKGIKNLSSFNLYLFGIFVFVVILKAPICQIFNLELNSIGLLIKNYPLLSIGMDPVSKSHFSQSLTVFYWAWWIAFMPMMALFVARISRGRTIKQIILGEIVWGGGGCLAVFTLFSGYSLHLQQSGIIDLVSIMNLQGREKAVITILETLPLPQIIITVYLILTFIFLSTTIDSTAYILASVCTKTLKGNEQPAKWNRMLWAVILLLFTLGLIIIGGLEAVQTASIIVGFPLVFVCLVIMSSVKKMLTSHKGIINKEALNNSDNMMEKTDLLQQVKDNKTKVFTD